MSTPHCIECAQLDAALGTTLDERDKQAELLDAITDAVAAWLDTDFGEHSSANSPWHNALHALREQQASSTSPTEEGTES
ncbi:hypothetical protein AB0J47_41845 [Nocardia sp. NPDC049737]|uniref:hypothetical protein n=1 Tax=Nocardia sp. NPDC049737 TaxID=3154358 RepID=UPI00343C8D04